MTVLLYLSVLSGREVSPSTSPLPSTKCLFSTALPQNVLSSKQQELLPSPSVCAKKPAVPHLMKVYHYLFKDLIGHHLISTSKT